MIATFDESFNRIGVVLGASVNSDGTPSRLLRLRVKAGAALREIPAYLVDTVRTASTR